METMYVNEESGEPLATIRRASDESIRITVSPHIQELLRECSERTNLPEQVRRNPFYVHHYRDDGRTFADFPPTFSSQAQADAALGTLGELASVAEAFLREQ